MDTKQFIKYSLLYGKSSSVTGSFWKRYTVRYIFPCLSMITTANSSILMITVFIKIDIKSIIYKKWRRSLTPIISCNGRRNGSRNPSSIRVVRVILKFFSAGNEFSFFTTIIKSFITGSRTIAASITLKSGLKNSLVSENVLKSFVVT